MSDYTLVTITWKIRDPDGSAADTGSYVDWLLLDGYLQDTTDNETIAPRTIRTMVNSTTGVVEKSTGVAPQLYGGATYQATIHVEGVTPDLVLNYTLPATGTVEIPDLSPVPPPSALTIYSTRLDDLDVLIAMGGY